MLCGASLESPRREGGGREGDREGRAELHPSAWVPTESPRSRGAPVPVSPSARSRSSSAPVVWLRRPNYMVPSTAV